MPEREKLIRLMWYIRYRLRAMRINGAFKGSFMVTQPNDVKPYFIEIAFTYKRHGIHSSHVIDFEDPDSIDSIGWKLSTFADRHAEACRTYEERNIHGPWGE